MANRQFYPMNTQGTQHVNLNFSFAPAGAGAPVVGEGCAGYVASITRTGAGAFLITLVDKYAACVSAEAGLQLNAVADLKCQFGAIDVVSAKTLALNVLAVATPTDIAANANNKVHVQLVLRNSSVTP